MRNVVTRCKCTDALFCRADEQLELYLSTGEDDEMEEEDEEEEEWGVEGEEEEEERGARLLISAARGGGAAHRRHEQPRSPPPPRPSPSRPLVPAASCGGGASTGNRIPKVRGFGFGVLGSGRSSASILVRVTRPSFF